MIYRSLNILKGVTVSHQTNHITHSGTKFQTSEECFPNQFCHPNKREVAFSNKAIESIFLTIPNIQKTSLKAWVVNEAKDDPLQW